MAKNLVKSEAEPEYKIKPDSEDDAVIKKALLILEKRLSARRSTEALTFSRTGDAHSYCKLKLAGAGREHFAVLFLDIRHRLIAFEIISSGTLDQASVYTREIARAAMRHNAAALILTHNHPSGVTDPSVADQSITKKIIDALSLLDVRVLDHLIVGEDRTVSLAELGMM